MFLFWILTALSSPLKIHWETSTHIISDVLCVGSPLVDVMVFPLSGYEWAGDSSGGGGTAGHSPHSPVALRRERTRRTLALRGPNIPRVQWNFSNTFYREYKWA